MRPVVRATSPPCPERATTAPTPAPADLGDPGCDAGRPGSPSEPGMQERRPALAMSAGLFVAGDSEADRQPRPQLYSADVRASPIDCSAGWRVAKTPRVAAFAAPGQ